MKLYYSKTSPFVRKVLVQAIETGLRDRVTLQEVVTSPVAVDAMVAAANPLKKIPALELDNGQVLFDSRVICEYLDSLHDGAAMHPAHGEERWQVLRLQALADGLIDAAVLGVYEVRVRPEEMQYRPWVDAQLSKVDGALDELERLAPTLGDRVDIGTIAAACALEYLDFRFPNHGWRPSRPQLSTWIETFSARQSMQSTRPA